MRAKNLAGHIARYSVLAIAVAAIVAPTGAAWPQKSAPSAEIRLARSHYESEVWGMLNERLGEERQKEKERLEAEERARRTKEFAEDADPPALRVEAPETVPFSARAFRVKGFVGDTVSQPRVTADGVRQPLFERSMDDPYIARHTFRFDFEVPIDKLGEKRVVLEACDKAGNCVTRDLVVEVVAPGPDDVAGSSPEQARLLAELEAAEGERRAAVARAREAEEAARRIAAKPRRQATVAVDHPNIAARNHALIVGNNDYRRLPDLRSPIGDARALAQVLTSRYAFRTDDVTLLLDADRRAILGALEDLRQELGPDDRLLIYYAGHGEIDPVTEEGFWQPVDAEPGRQFTWIANDDVRRSLKGMPARHVLVMADSCFSGSLTRSAGDYAAVPKDRFFTEIDASVSRKVISSGGVKPVMDSGSGGHSVFAYYLLTALRENERPYLASFELFGKLARAVTNNSSQKPEFGTVREAGDEGAGDFTFILSERD